MTATNENKHELIRQEVVPFFEKAKRFGETKRSKFAAWVGVSCKEVGDVFPNGEWAELRDQWLRLHLRKAMTEVYERSVVREEFNIRQILTVFKIERKEFKRIVGDEWHALAKTLPTIREKVLADFRHLVEINIPADELTAEKLFKYSGYGYGLGGWISTHLCAAKIELAARQAEQQMAPPTEVLGARRGVGWDGPFKRYPCRQHGSEEPSDGLWFQFRPNKEGPSDLVYVNPSLELKNKGRHPLTGM